MWTSNGKKFYLFLGIIFIIGLIVGVIFLLYLIYTTTQTIHENRQSIYRLVGGTPT